MQIERVDGLGDLSSQLSGKMDLNALGQAAGGVRV